ncbi:hypothetical protein ABIB40_003263 [Pedobacter sp. UYP30]|uniref:hypothetical protein n=1 Tax=Pedobacter sp. UYP30 TaxID=1756400 RepID=UPI003398B901
MKPILSLFSLLAIFLFSCNNQKSKITESQNSSVVIEAKQSKNLSSNSKKDTVYVNYGDNKVILDLLPLLPDAAFRDFKWTKNERQQLVEDVKKNGYYIDRDSFHLNLIYAQPNTIGYSVIDGFWEMTIYKCADNSYLVIANTITGDDNSLNVFNYRNGVLKSAENQTAIFGDFRKELMIPGAKDCAARLKELRGPIFDYNFRNLNQVEIESALYLTKEKYQNCLKGNTLVYQFIPTEKKFKLKKVYWKEKK